LEYIYSAMLLHSTGQKITEDNVKKVLKSAGAKVDEARVKALISALEGVNIEKVIKQTTIPVAAVPVAKEEKMVEKKEKPEKAEKKVEEAASGLASLFG